ncbi:MED6 mediator subfamily complex component [Popillia japonica]|uniref:Mediator of RNA polymerase II transcription subunit 6 n=1 Tax=Popillia japonica TaxID=7064 RepID=A0AAW1JXY6_POPJA
MGVPSNITDNPLSVSWHDSAWIPILNTANVMDYFSERSNPFFDRTCNNEIVKMQRLNPDQLQNMVGLEYVLLHVQEPILYVIRKQHRHSHQQVTPLADYYIIAGVVYQAPDLASVLNSRLLSTVHHLQSAFEESSGFSRYHPSKGYSWDFKSQRGNTEKPKLKEEKPREEPSSLFQRQRVDMLLGELIKKFPLPMPPQAKTISVPIKTESENGTSENKEIKTEKHEKIKPPPEKKPRIT